MAKRILKSQQLWELTKGEDDLVSTDFDKLADITASATDINKTSSLTLAGTFIADVTTTWTANEVTADGGVTIADGSSPTAAEAMEYVVEVDAKVEAILDLLIAAGIMASS